MPHTIYHDFRIRASVRETFEAITEPKHLVNWWPLRCSGVPEVGNEYNFFFAPEYDWYGKVVQLENNRSFHIKMTVSDPDWDPTTFGFDLEPEVKFPFDRFYNVTLLFVSLPNVIVDLYAVFSHKVTD